MKRVIHGDCLDVMPDIADKSIDMILCDLPYGTTACKWDTVIPFEPLWLQYKRIIKDNGAIVLTASQPFTSALVMSNPDMFKYEWIWDKRMTTNFAMAKKQPLRNHENICVFYKKQSVYNPQLNNTQTLKPFGKIRGGPSDVCGNLGAKKNTGVGYPKTIITYARPNNLNNDGNLHPTQKPVALFEYLIKTYTNEGETVLDNCAGSGTTAIACLNTCRRYILIEKEKQYIDIINKRIAEHELQQTII
jgi:site-specific DNA-methyltransferase (adenine-specific)